jgi:hypothetical protein
VKNAVSSSKGFSPVVEVHVSGTLDLFWLGCELVSVVAEFFRVSILAGGEDQRGRREIVSIRENE